MTMLDWIPVLAFLRSINDTRYSYVDIVLPRLYDVVPVRLLQTCSALWLLFWFCLFCRIPPIGTEPVVYMYLFVLFLPLVCRLCPDHLPETVSHTPFALWLLGVLVLLVPSRLYLAPSPLPIPRFVFAFSIRFRLPSSLPFLPYTVYIGLLGVPYTQIYFS